MSTQADLEALKAKIEDEMVCPLKDAATNIVFGKGNSEAKILFIGEAPGEQEDLQGVPFVGRAGKELDKALHTIGLTIDDVYIANILKYRPPKNRDPTTEEIQRHTPYLIEQIKIIKPTIIATLGNYATKFVLNNFAVKGMQKVKGISILHGKTHDVTLDDVRVQVIPIYHPAAMMYNPRVREAFEHDFTIFAQVLGLEVKNKRETEQQTLS